MNIHVSMLAKGIETITNKHNKQAATMQGCGNSQSCRTLSDKSSKCPVKRN